MHRRGRPPFQATRSRWRSERGWEVRARVERFVEPALLLLLSEGPVHGYDLLERLSRITGEERALDLGNLYRVLRALEHDGLVRSEWHSDLPGPAKRVYELTAEGRSVLSLWAEALRRLRDDVDRFLERTEGRR